MYSLGVLKLPSRARDSMNFFIALGSEIVREAFSMAVWRPYNITNIGSFGDATLRDCTSRSNRAETRCEGRRTDNCSEQRVNLSASAAWRRRARRGHSGLVIHWGRGHPVCPDTLFVSGKFCV